MIRLTQLTVFAVLFSSFSSVVYAQDDLKKAFEGYVEAFSNIDENKKINSVLVYLDQTYTSEVQYIGANGNMEKVTVTYDNFANTLSYLTHSNDFGITAKIKEIVESKVKGTNGYLEALGTYTIYFKGELAEVQDIKFKLTARKSADGSWKFLKAENERIVTERIKGTCFITIYESKNSYYSELIYPVGLSNQKKLDRYNVGYRGPNRMIISGSESYLWAEDGQVSQNGNNITKSTDPKIAIQNIVKLDNEATCTNFVVK